MRAAAAIFTFPSRRAGPNIAPAFSRSTRSHRTGPGSRRRDPRKAGRRTPGSVGVAAADELRARVLRGRRAEPGAVGEAWQLRHTLAAKWVVSRRAPRHAIQAMAAAHSCGRA